MAQNTIAALAAQLELHYPDEGTRSWNTGAPVRRMHIPTGVSSAVPSSEVPEHATGMLVRSGVYDVNRFCWGVRNLRAVVGHMNGNDFYYNEADDAMLGKLLDTRIGGRHIFGSDVSHHAF